MALLVSKVRAHGSVADILTSTPPLDQAAVIGSAVAVLATAACVAAARRGRGTTLPDNSAFAPDVAAGHAAAHLNAAALQYPFATALAALFVPPPLSQEAVGRSATSSSTALCPTVVLDADALIAAGVPRTVAASVVALVAEASAARASPSAAAEAMAGGRVVGPSEGGAPLPYSGVAGSLVTPTSESSGNVGAANLAEVAGGGRAAVGGLPEIPSYPVSDPRACQLPGAALGLRVRQYKVLRGRWAAAFLQPTTVRSGASAVDAGVPAVVIGGGEACCGTAAQWALTAALGWLGAAIAAEVERRLDRVALGGWRHPASALHRRDAAATSRIPVLLSRLEVAEAAAAQMRKTTATLNRVGPDCCGNDEAGAPAVVSWLRKAGTISPDEVSAIAAAVWEVGLRVTSRVMEEPSAADFGGDASFMLPPFVAAPAPPAAPAVAIPPVAPAIIVTSSSTGQHHHHTRSTMDALADEADGDVPPFPRADTSQPSGSADFSSSAVNAATHVPATAAPSMESPTTIMAGARDRSASIAATDNNHDTDFGIPPAETEVNESSDGGGSNNGGADDDTDAAGDAGDDDDDDDAWVESCGFTVAHLSAFDAVVRVFESSVIPSTLTSPVSINPPGHSSDRDIVLRTPAAFLHRGDANHPAAANREIAEAAEGDHAREIDALLEGNSNGSGRNSAADTATAYKIRAPEDVRAQLLRSCTSSCKRYVDGLTNFAHTARRHNRRCFARYCRASLLRSAGFTAASFVSAMLLARLATPAMETRQLMEDGASAIYDRYSVLAATSSETTPTSGAHLWRRLAGLCALDIGMRGALASLSAVADRSLRSAATRHREVQKRALTTAWTRVRLFIFDQYTDEQVDRVLCFANDLEGTTVQLQSQLLSLFRVSTTFFASLVVLGGFRFGRSSEGGAEDESAGGSLAVCASILGTAAATAMSARALKSLEATVRRHVSAGVRPDEEETAAGGAAHAQMRARGEILLTPAEVLASTRFLRLQRHSDATILGMWFDALNRGTAGASAAAAARRGGAVWWRSLPPTSVVVRAFHQHATLPLLGALRDTVRFIVPLVGVALILRSSSQAAANARKTGAAPTQVVKHIISRVVALEGVDAALSLIDSVRATVDAFETCDENAYKAATIEALTGSDASATDETGGSGVIPPSVGCSKLGGRGDEDGDAAKTESASGGVVVEESAEDGDALLECGYDAPALDNFVLPKGFHSPLGGAWSSAATGGPAILATAPDGQPRLLRARPSFFTSHNDMAATAATDASSSATAAAGATIGALAPAAPGTATTEPGTTTSKASRFHEFLALTERRDCPGTGARGIVSAQATPAAGGWLSQSNAALDASPSPAPIAMDQSAAPDRDLYVVVGLPQLRSQDGGPLSIRQRSCCPDAMRRDTPQRRHEHRHHHHQQQQEEPLQHHSGSQAILRTTLCFAYPSRPYRPVLRLPSASFVLPLRCGSIVAVTGPSGCGKSTLLRLLLREYDTIGGIDCPQLCLASARPGAPVMGMGGAGSVSAGPATGLPSASASLIFGMRGSSAANINATASALNTPPASPSPQPMGDVPASTPAPVGFDPAAAAASPQVADATSVEDLRLLALWTNLPPRWLRRNLFGFVPQRVELLPGSATIVENVAFVPCSALGGGGAIASGIGLATTGTFNNTQQQASITAATVGGASGRTPPPDATSRSMNLATLNGADGASGSKAAPIAKSREQVLARVRRCMELAGLGSFLATCPEGLFTTLGGPSDLALSGGQLLRLGVARALYTGARVLLLDEPTAALDPGARDELLDTFRRLVRAPTSAALAGSGAAAGGASMMLSMRSPMGAMPSPGEMSFGAVSNSRAGLAGNNGGIAGARRCVVFVTHDEIAVQSAHCVVRL